MLTIKTPVNQIPKIGPVFQKRLKRMGIETIEDLLWHFPLRYEDFSQLCPISKIKLNEKCCIAGRILEIKTSRTWKRKMSITKAVVEDKTGAIKAVWFNQPFLTRTLKQGDNLFLAGKVSFNKDGVFLSSPIYEKTFSSESASVSESAKSTLYQSKRNTGQTHTARIIPIYPQTAGLSSRWLRYILKPLLLKFKNHIKETLPSQIIEQNNFLPINTAIWQIHFPDSMEMAEQAKKRFSFEQLFLIELSALQERLRLFKEKAPAIPMNIEVIKELVGTLGFKLTNAQRKCAWQILKDIEQPRPMSRLLEGDVGSGKTVVAVIAALNAIKAGYQAAFMAPTEILAKQHFKEAAKLIQPFKIRIALLTGKQDKIISQKLGHRTKSGFTADILEISRSKILEKTKKGEIDILIGTHSLIQDKVRFGNLALAIVDEQHRFGVEQRAKLCQNKAGASKALPHFLSMTATPIPRTLALTVYGDLDLSIIDEMPPGRKKVITKIVPPKDRNNTYEFVKQEVKKGKQVFVICPRIESGKTETSGEQNQSAASEKAKDFGWSEAKAVKEEYEKLNKIVFPDLKIAMLHGKMKTKEKEKTMKEFKAGKTDIVVSTSVVEVGVDIPNATVMLIEGAERFGLAQLHQFRGRVGRSDIQSYCFLFTESRSKKTYQRLQAIIKAKNGFELAQKDLEIRGPGSLYGIKQWGMPDLAMENLKDIKLVEKTRETAKGLLQESPQLKKYPALKEKVALFKKRIHFE